MNRQGHVWYGERTRQCGGPLRVSRLYGVRPTVNLQKVQRIRKRTLFFAVVLIFLFAAVSQPVLAFSPTFHETLEDSGIVLILVAILGRGWCALYIAGRKRTVLVQSGPYSLARNPLYGFTLVGTIGIGLQFGGVTFALLGLLIVSAVFLAVVRQEETYLLAAYGQEYRDYMARVPRFLPRFSCWRDEQKIEVSPGLVMHTFLDTSLFLLAVPAFDGLESLHTAGWLPVFFHLY